jgi:uncharacterized membrane protein YuzA (DUF378 family)
MNSTITGFALIAVGALTMIGAALNWGIVSRRGKLLNRLLGDSAARVVYFVGGIFVFLMGIGKVVGMDWF